MFMAIVGAFSLSAIGLRPLWMRSAPYFGDRAIQPSVPPITMAKAKMPINRMKKVVVMASPGRFSEDYTRVRLFSSFDVALEPWFTDILECRGRKSLLPPFTEAGGRG